MRKIEDLGEGKFKVTQNSETKFYEYISSVNGFIQVEEVSDDN